MVQQQDITSKLLELGYRLTPQRMMVVSAIESSDDHLSAEEIHALAVELVCCGSPLVVVTDDLQRLGFGVTSFKPEGLANG